MYCSHCGKKVNDTMLFCPFCGDPIVIPEQDEEEPVAPVAASDPKPEAPIAVQEPEPEPEPVPEPEPEPVHLEEPEPAPMPTPKPPREVGEAEAELLDWESTRREYVADDVWDDRRSRETEAFAPLSFEQDEPEPAQDWREEIARKKEQAAPQKKVPELNGEGQELLHLDGVAPKLEAGVEGAKPASDAREKKRKGKAPSTLVPPKAMDPNDIFMDGSGKRDYDDFDDFDTPSDKAFDGGDFAFEDADEGSFFMRHIRGIVGLALFVILLLMFVIFAFSKSGQKSLARLNLAWSTDAYSQLGYQSYQAERYDEAGLYYERALQREPDNYSFASSAAMAYVESGNREKAAEMLKRCAQINPQLLEPYIYLLNLYPDAADRPWDVTQLLQQGYQIIGDTRLNVTG